MGLKPALLWLPLFVASCRPSGAAAPHPSSQNVTGKESSGEQKSETRTAQSDAEQDESEWEEGKPLLWIGGHLEYNRVVFEFGMCDDNRKGIPEPLAILHVRVISGGIICAARQTILRPD